MLIFSLRIELTFVNIFFRRSTTLLCVISKKCLSLRRFIHAFSFKQHNIVEYIVFLNELERVLKLKLNKYLERNVNLCNNCTNARYGPLHGYILFENFCLSCSIGKLYVFAKYCVLIINTTKHQNILLDLLVPTQNNTRKHKLFSTINNK